MGDSIEQRKQDHLDLCRTDDVAFKQTSHLLDNVRLLHQSLPELSLDEIDTGLWMFGKRLRAPIVISAMTGGTDRAAEVNQALASIANEHGYAFGLGSQRAMQKNPETAWTFDIRKYAPDALVFGNLGLVQAKQTPTKEIKELVKAIDVDALCIHMNPAMELIQEDGDRDFRDGVATFERLVNELSIPIIAKETGNGISTDTARKLRNAGVKHVDVSGAGGTSWVGVETLRAQGSRKDLGQSLWDWGIPTAASIQFAVKQGLQVIATGGLRTGLDIARAIALGANAGGIARAVLQAFMEGGKEGASQFLNQVEQELRAVMLLCGTKSIDELQRIAFVLTGELRYWFELSHRI